jgi:hypothetical protein
MEELFECNYDNPIDKDGNKKPNRSLGVFNIIETLESDFYNSLRLVISENGVLFLVVEREVGGFYGGTRNRLIEIKTLRQ